MNGDKKALEFTNWSKSVAVLTELATRAASMYDATEIGVIAAKFHTSRDCVAQNAKRHHDVLQIVKNQRDEIKRLAAELASAKIKSAQLCEPGCPLPTKEEWRLADLESRRRLGQLTAVELDGEVVGRAKPAT